MGHKNTSRKLRLFQPAAAVQSEDRPHPGTEVEFGLVEADPALIADGWLRRHLVDPDRARESVELYESMGFEVRVRELTPEDFGPLCRQCASIVCRSHVLIYTRKRQLRNKDASADRVELETPSGAED